MVELNKIETKVFHLLTKKISVKSFEKWVYSSNWLEETLNEDEYLDLISLNYNNSEAKYEIKKILKDRFSLGKFETIKLLNLLNSIIEKDVDAANSIILTYNLYCKGYQFFREIGLSYGLSVECPPNFDRQYYFDLNENEQKEVLAGAYPEVKLLAKEIYEWLSSGEIILLGTKNNEFGHWDYEDNRSKSLDRNRNINDIQKSKSYPDSLLNIYFRKFLSIFKNRKPNS